MQISGGSTPLAKEGARVVVAVVVVVVVVVFFAYPADFSSFCDFLTQRAPPLDPPLQMDKFKEITEFDVYSVKTCFFYIMLTRDLVSITAARGLVSSHSCRRSHTTTEQSLVLLGSWAVSFIA